MPEPTRPSRLRTEAVTLGYGGTPILNELSTTVPDGSFTVIIGPNACGKSTLLRGLSRLLAPDSGQVILDGRAITEYSAKEVARRLGLLPQSALAPDGITVADLVARGRYPHQGLLRQWSDDDEAAVTEALDATGTRDLAPRRVDELSGGQRQRVSIARAVALDPVLLIADEPTSALDVSVQATVLDLFRRVQAELNFACLFISHDLAVVDELADRVAVMRRGELVEEGVREAVLADPQHEYTQKLLESAPVPDPDTQRERRRARLAAV